VVVHLPWRAFGAARRAGARQERTADTPSKSTRLLLNCPDDNVCGRKLPHAAGFNAHGLYRPRSALKATAAAVSHESIRAARAAADAPRRRQTRASPTRFRSTQRPSAWAWGNRTTQTPPSGCRVEKGNGIGGREGEEDDKGHQGEEGSSPSCMLWASSPEQRAATSAYRWRPHPSPSGG